MTDEEIAHYAEHLAHTLVHLGKALMRVGITIPTLNLDLCGSVLQDALIEAITEIAGCPFSPETRGALIAATLRWLNAVDLLRAYNTLGQEWRAMAFVDQMMGVEALTALANDMLDDHFAQN